MGKITYFQATLWNNMSSIFVLLTHSYSNSGWGQPRGRPSNEVSSCWGLTCSRLIHRCDPLSSRVWDRQRHLRQYVQTTQGPREITTSLSLSAGICWGILEAGWILKRRDAGELRRGWWEPLVECMWGMSEGYKTRGDNRSKETREKVALQVEGGSEHQKHF